MVRQSRTWVWVRWGVAVWALVVLVVVVVRDQRARAARMLMGNKLKTMSFAMEHYEAAPAPTLDGAEHAEEPDQ